MGDSNLGVDWPNKKDANKRYEIMLSVIKDKKIKIKLLDFGCGHFWNILKKKIYQKIL